MKHRVKFWEFVSDNIVALSAVAAGVGVLIWQALTNPANLDPVSAAVLALLCLLVTSEMVESRKRLDSIQETIDEEMSKIHASLPVAEIRRFSDSESGIAYLCSRIEETETSIDFASIDIAPRTGATQVRERLLRVRIDVAAEGKVRFRYLFRANEGRIRRVKEMLSKAVPGKFFVAGLPSNVRNTPLMPFVILDGEEVYARSPYEIGEEEVYVSTRHPDIVSLFSKWFDRLWTSAEKIDPTMPYEQQVTEFDRFLHA